MKKERNSSLVEEDVVENEREKNINTFKDTIPFVKEYETLFKN